MFSVKLPVNHYVRDRININSAFGTLVLQTNDNYKSTISVARLTEIAQVQNDRVFLTDDLIVSQIENLIKYSLPVGVTEVIKITIGNSVYQLSNLEDENLESGEFRFDRDRQTLSIKAKGDDLNNLNLVTLSYPKRGITQVAQVNKNINKNHVCTISSNSLSLITRFNADGMINIQRNFQSHASLSFSFRACKDKRSEILRELANGTKFAAFNLNWVIASLSITNLANSNNILVNVSCQDSLASVGIPSKSPLDKRIRKKVGTKSSHKKKRNVGEIASLSGVKYTGSNISFRVPRATSYEDTISLRELVDSRAKNGKGFAFYTNGTGVEIRPWKATKTHVISDSQIRSGRITYQYQGHGNYLGGVKLHTELRNKKVNLNFDPDSGDNNAGFTERWVFEGCQDESDLVSPSEFNGAYYQQPDRESFRSMNINFDAGGRTKSATKIYELNGTPTFEVREEYGFVFTSDQVYLAQKTEKETKITLKSNINPNALWKRTKKTVTNYIYDEKEGYLLETRVKGTQLTRLVQETDALEVAVLKLKISEATDTKERFNLLKQVGAYTFDYNLPINDRTYYRLEKHRDYFEGTVAPGSDCNDFWVEPKFLSRMDRISRTLLVKEDPREKVGEIERPPIVTGQYLKETELTTITNTQFPFKFEKRNLSKNSQGFYLKDAIALGNVSQNNGKPGVHNRLIRTQDYRSGENRFNYLRYRYQRYFLDSPNVTPSISTIEGSKSYPDIDNPNLVKEIAETELSIINTQNSCTTTIDIDYRAGIEEGDFAIAFGKRWKIFRIDNNFKIVNRKLMSESLRLSLGLYLEPKLRLNNRVGCSKNSNTTPAP